MTERALLGALMASGKRSLDPRRFPDEVFELYSIPAFDAGAPIPTPGHEIGSPKQVVRPDDVLLSKIVPHIRRAWVVPPDAGSHAIGSSEWIIFRSERFHPPYLRHVLMSNRFHAAFMATVAGVGGSLLRARPAYVSSIEIPLPPVAEQRQIAGVLDQADELRAKRRASIALLDSLNESIFLDMFGDPALNAQGHEVRPLADVVALGTIVTYGIVQAGPEHPGGVPYIRTGDIVDGRILAEGLRRTAPSIAKKFGRSRVGVGEIVMSIRATVGTTAIVPAEADGANLTQGTARIAPGSDTEPSYLLAFLRTAAAQRWISRQVKGATFREITLKRLRELPVMVPPLEAQQEFVLRTGQVTAIRSTLATSGHGIDSLFSSLQYRAFAGQQ